MNLRVFLKFALQQVFFGIIGIFVRLHVHEAKNLKGINKSAIFSSNHTSIFDVPIILKSIPWPQRRQIRIPAAADYFFPEKRTLANLTQRFIISPLLKLVFDIYPFNRLGKARESLVYSIGLLKRGNALLYFPEGTRSTDGAIHKFKRGIGIVAKESRAKIIPVKVRGLYQILPKGNIFPKFGNAEVTFGKPLDPARYKTAEEIAAIVERKIRAL